MTNYGDFYYCELCGHVVSIAHEGSPTLTCCGQPMQLLEAKTSGTGEEKHIPVIIPNGDTTIVKVGPTDHVMMEKHYVSFIELEMKDKERIRARLTDKPEAEFKIKADDIEAAYEYCNLHGLWVARQ